MTLETLQARLDALLEAALSGKLIVEFDGSKVQYRSMRELREAIQLCRDEIAKLSSPSSRQRAIFADTGRCG